MPVLRRIRRPGYGARAVLAVVLLAASVAGCTTAGTAYPAPQPPILGPDATPPATPPWSLRQLVYHQCIVLGTADLARFGFGNPPQPRPHESYCHWQSAGSAPTPIEMFFEPDIVDKYTELADSKQGEKYFRRLTIASRSAFLIDEHRDGGYRNCMIWVSVPSGGVVRFEYAAHTGNEDLCTAATDVVTVIAERVQ